MFLLFGSIIYSGHVIACVFYLSGTFPAFDQDSLNPVPGSVSSGWVDRVFQGSDRLCSCYGNDLHFDSYENMCVNTTDQTAPVHQPCEEMETPAPSHWEYYTKSLFLSLQDPMIDSGYTHTMPEIVSAIFATGTVGFIWGAVAGAWGTLFAANQMASQAYNMKKRQLQEFCKLKGLDWSVRSKLYAHYEHLYPEQVIVDEGEIISDLPPRLRDDLVRQLYGKVIGSVPLFFGLGTPILTELCLALLPFPALKGQVVVREGMSGNDIYIVSNGRCRVTQHMHMSDDVERARQWISEVFDSFGKVVKLYEPNQRTLLNRLTKEIRIISRRNADKLKLLTDQLEQLGNFHDASDDDRERIDELQFQIEQTTVGGCTFDELATADALEPLLRGHNLAKLLGTAKKQRVVSFAFDGLIHEGSATVISTESKRQNIAGDTPLEMFCEAIRSGVVLIELLNLFLPSRRRLPIWKPSLLDAAVGNTVALADELVSGTVGAVNEVTQTSLAATGAVTGAATAVVPNKLGGAQLQRAQNTANRIAVESTAAVGSAIAGALHSSEQNTGSGNRGGVSVVGSRLADLATGATSAVSDIAQQGLKTADVATGSAVAYVPDKFGGSQMVGATGGINRLAAKTVESTGTAAASAASASAAVSGRMMGSWMMGGPKTNIMAFLDCLRHPEGPFAQDPELLFSVDDLLTFDIGRERDQAEKQRRILLCIIELAWTVSHFDDYLGPQLDEVNLGSLTAGDFFGELSVLPLKSSWTHRRTVTSITNSLLYSLNKQRVERIEQAFPELKHKYVYSHTSPFTFAAKVLSHRFDATAVL